MNSTGRIVLTSQQHDDSVRRVSPSPSSQAFTVGGNR